MPPSKSHFVTTCQQLLALGAVLAVLTPAASVVSLDVVRQHPATGAGQPAGHGHPVELTAYAGQQRASRVPTAPVDAQVEEYPLTAGAETRGRMALAARTVRIGDQPGTREVVSRAEPVVGYGGVGITWDPGASPPADELGFEVRSRTGDTWSAWTTLDYEDEHGPDPDSAEARHARPGTDVMFVGDVDQVQVRATATGTAPPAGMRLAVVSPGRAASTARQAPALGAASSADSDQRTLARSSARSTRPPQPTIYSRAQWGANERLRDGFAGYGDISGGFVHHTVNSNGYTRAEVPGIIRGIYAYHTQSRGWSDIGYNFVVDRFGRIWEGRYGGIDRAVVGAHTLGYNDDSFAMSAIGNYETARPSDAMLRAYGDLFAWKLSKYGVDPEDSSVTIEGDSSLQAINGHRDAGSTACPGRYLYAKIPQIRDYAAAAIGASVLPEITEKQVDSDLVGTAYPDLVVRRRADDRGLILPTGGLARFVRPSVIAPSGWGSRRFLVTEDLTGDDRPDLVTFSARGSLQIRPGLDTGSFGRVARRSGLFRDHDIVAAAGDLNGDGRVDFVGRRAGHLVTFLRTRRGGFHRMQQDGWLRGYAQLVGAGDVTGDGRPDLWGRTRSGRLVLKRGLGGGEFSARTRIAGDWSNVDEIAGGVDYTDDGVPDLLARRANGKLVLLPARRDGTLARAQGPVGRVGQLSMISGAGQLTGSSAPDLVAARTDGALVVVRNRGTFDLGRPVDTRQSFRRGNLLLNAGDFTGDGVGDVIMRRRIGSLWLYRGTGGGRLANPVWIAGKRPFRNVTDLRVVADVTGDQLHDLVGKLGSGKLMVWPGNGTGRLGKRYQVQTAGDPSARSFSGYNWVVPISDLRRRGRPDVVVRDRDGYLYRLNGTRSGFTSPRYLGETGAYDLGG